MADALDQLAEAVAARNQGESRQFALDVSKTGLDLLLQYRSRIDVDFARLDLWVRQLIIDIEAGDEGGVASDLAILDIILFRLSNIGNERDRNDVRAVQHHLGAIRIGADHPSAAALLDRARRVQSVLSSRVRAQED